MNTHNKFYVMNRKFGCCVKKKKRGYKQVRTHQILLGKKAVACKKTSVVPVHRLQLGYIVLVWVLILKNRPG
jgi:hypothetical protein